MAENTTEVKVNQAVLVGLNSPALDREETATERSMEELAALLETAGGACVPAIRIQLQKPSGYPSRP